MKEENNVENIDLVMEEIRKRQNNIFEIMQIQLLLNPAYQYEFLLQLIFIFSFKIRKIMKLFLFHSPYIVPIRNQ